MPTYFIRVKGNLAEHWSCWFADMAIAKETIGEAILTGPRADQAALHGVLERVCDLGLPLLAVTMVTEDAQTSDQRLDP